MKSSAVASSPSPRPVSNLNNRLHTRFDKLFPILIGSELFGDTVGVARNISTGGLLVEMQCLLPLGAVVTVHFQAPREDGSVDELVARAEVKHHHVLNFGTAGGATSTRATGLRFLDFDDRPSLDGLPSSRQLH